MTRSRSGPERLTLTALAALAWFGVILQLILSLRLSLANGNSVANGLVVYLGFFTVLSNIFIGLVASTRLTDAHSGLRSETARGCATTAIVLVGIAYHFLLRHVWDPQGWQWLADFVLHYAVPVASLAYWLMFPPQGQPRIVAPLAWGLYPLAYIVYVFIRGELISSYPYHFIDVGQLGYVTALTHTLGLVIAFVLLGFVIQYLAAFRRSRRMSATSG